ncbi:unnamed protein product [Auanema sp. JU1783]|nr:unnamed protein product [Auanema sp. JU1783]
MYSRLFIFLYIVKLTHELQCYSCVVPEDVTDFSRFCSKEVYCTGKYCYKGINELDSGFYLGCVDSPPIDKKTSVCKKAENSRIRINCYCKNNHFCNSSNIRPLLNISFNLFIVIILFILL